MQLEVGLRVSQEQRLLLLPQMLQAIEVLQLSTQDLLQRIQTELAENETLEIAPSTPDPPEEGPASREPETWLEEEERPPSGRRAREEEFDPLSQLPDRGLSLHNHLLEQLGLIEAPPEVRELTSFLIGSLDHNGHLSLGEEDLKEIFGPEAPVPEALDLLRSMDPPGVGQPGSKESLIAQIPEGDPDAEILVRIIRDHLEELARNRYPRVAKALSLSIEELKELLGKLRDLDPCPGRRFDREENEILRPDVVVRREDGDYEVYVEETRVPPLRIREEYLDMARARGVSREARTYLRGKLGSARDLMASIAQRFETLGRVVRAVFDRQREFLEKGVPGLKPLKMQEIADAVGVHLSTVSRAIAHKCVQTDFGIFPLRDLFDGGKPVGGGAEEGSGEARSCVKEKLKRLIEGEDRTMPYSDGQLGRLLEEEGLHIARRTVAKYRKELGFPSSWRRREY